MTVWFDVTLLEQWPYSFLTGIQRTEVGILAELLKVRKDISLFALRRGKHNIEKVEASGLPRLIREKIGVASCGRSHEAVPPEIASDAALETSHRRSLFSKLRSKAGPFLRQTLGDDAAAALTNFLRSGLYFVRVLRRRPRGAQPAPSSPQPVRIAPSEILFQPGDICLSLAATWWSEDYGEIIAQNLRGGEVKCINLFYDLIPALFPEWMPAEQSIAMSRWTRKQIENADCLLTISRFQKGVIERFIRDEHLPTRPVHAVLLGDDPVLVANGGDHKGSLPTPRLAPDRPFVLCVSTLDVRKNQSLLYQIWKKLSAELGDRCPQLVLVGTPHLHVNDLLHQIRYDRSVNRLILPLRDIVDEELAWYYRNCLFTTYPSIYEGWGLPVSESLALGRYCLCSDKTSLPEVGGDFVDYFDPFDFYGCYRLFLRAITDPEYVGEREADIRKRYVRHGWNITAQQVSAIVDSYLPKPEDNAREPAEASPAA
jgi:glycosyltransferase involved in cell wall biosynthesis